ncbi:MAG: hypothetical protein V7607_4850 [Solirubrobacteraceae bacterium]
MELMKLEDAPDGTRYVTLHGAALGRLTRLESGYWQCEWRSTSGSHETPTQLEQDNSERAERWAFDEVANALVMEEQARRKHEGTG